MSHIYMKVNWQHDHAHEPVTIYSEVDARTRYETRKVHVFADGTRERADADHETERTGLGLVPVPHLAEITAAPDLSAYLVPAEEFEAEWERAAVR